MKIHDSLMGGLLLLIAGALWFASAALPNPTMQPYGPGFFPRIIALLLGFAALLLVFQGIAERGKLAQPDAWMLQPRAVLRVLLVTVGTLVFAFAARPVGFIPCGILLLWAMLVADGRPWLVSLLTAVAIVLVTHSAFYFGFRVQLPWGVLQPLRW